MAPNDPPSRSDSRDRDTSGRARNSRPRDGLGRPMPYGAPGVARQPEGIIRTPNQTLRSARRELAEGRPFHAHEIFEDAWKSAPEADRELWRGLAQLAVGLTHAARGNQTGATTLLARGADSIEPYRDRPAHGVDVGLLVDWARASAESTTQTDDPDAIELPELWCAVPDSE